MKRFILIFAALALFAVPALSQNNTILTSNIIQPHKHIEGSTVSAAYSSGIYTIPSGKWAKAVELTPGVAGGVLKVHLVGDAAASYYSMPLDSNSRKAAIFDKIIQSGTTVTLNNLIIFTMD